MADLHDISLVVFIDADMIDGMLPALKASAGAVPHAIPGFTSPC